MKTTIKVIQKFDAKEFEEAMNTELAEGAHLDVEILSANSSWYGIGEEDYPIYQAMLRLVDDDE